MEQINAYGTSRSTNNTKTTSGTKNNSLGVDDFMKLLSTQLANQDVMNPMNDTEFISQLAQFTALQATQVMSEVMYAQYGSSMIGKNVLVASYDQNGNYKEESGVVESVKFANGDCHVTVNGTDYTMSAIMEVLDKPKVPEEPEAPETPDGDGGETEKPAEETKPVT